MDSWNDQLNRLISYREPDGRLPRATQAVFDMEVAQWEFGLDLSCEPCIGSA